MLRSCESSVHHSRKVNRPKHPGVRVSGRANSFQKRVKVYSSAAAFDSGALAFAGFVSALEVSAESDEEVSALPPAAGAAADFLSRLSVTYQPEPLKMMPLG